MDYKRQSVSANCWNQTHVARLTATRINHKAINSYWSTVIIIKNCTWFVMSRILEPFFCVQNSHSHIIQVENQSQTWDIPEFMTANRLSTNITWIGVEIFSQHKLCSILIEQLINLKNVSPENSIFWTDPLDWVMDGWSVRLSSTVMIILSSRLLKKSSKSKIQDRPVNAGLYGFQTSLFICDGFVRVPYFDFKTTNDWKTEQISCLSRQQILARSIKILLSHEKNLCCQ